MDTTMLFTKIKLSLSAIILTLAFLIAGCSSISVNQDYDPGYDFSKLKTFGFIPITEDSGIDQLNATRLGDAIKANLTAKGYTLAENADFGVALFFIKQTKTNVQSYGYGYRYGYGRYGGGMGGVDVSQYDEGTLVIDFVDMAKQELVWRGIGTGAVSESASVEERTENINTAVMKILEQFPPTKEE
jgi:hypothetical protein